MARVKRSGEIFDVVFAPWMVAGVRTEWENMRPFVHGRPDARVHVAEVHPYKSGGLLESLPIPSTTVKGNIRSMLCTQPLFRLPNVDALWIPKIRVALPFLLARGWWRGTVVAVSTDAPDALLAGFGDLYAKSGLTSVRGRAREAIDRFCLTRANTLLFPWSHWAARSLREDYGVPDDRIHVIPPGIDLRDWTMLTRQRAAAEPVRLLFVGGDFERKGGPLLLDVFRRHLQGRCELHLVTRDRVEEQPGIHIYRDFQPNDPHLRALYAHCDIFVLPTLADCFSLASMEAMATGLPVITSAVGGIPDIVADGESGFLIDVGDGAALAERIDLLLQFPELRARMGAAGRRIVESRFDAARNAERQIDLIVDACRTRDALAGDRISAVAEV